MLGRIKSYIVRSLKRFTFNDEFNLFESLHEAIQNTYYLKIFKTMGDRRKGITR